MSNSKSVEKKTARSLDNAEIFHMLADTIPTLCWMADPDGYIYWYNKRWYEYTGTTPKQMEGWGWQSVHDPKQLPHVLKEWKASIKHEKPFDMVFPIRGVDGKFKPFLTRITPHKDKNGLVTGWYGINTDISELQAAEELLKASEEKFRSYAEALPQMAFTTDEKGNVTSVNQRWYEYFSNMETTKNWGLGDQSVYHPDDLKRAMDTWKESLGTGKDYEIEYRLRRYDGQYRWHLGHAIAVRDISGKIIQWVGTNTDIHEQKRHAHAQAFLLQATKDLSESLDYRKTLKTVTRLCVPEVADWCTVDLINEKGDFEQVAVTHIDPAKVDIAREFRARNPVYNDDPTGVPQVVRTGKYEFYPYIDNALLEASIDDPDTLQLMKDLQLHSVIIVPITVKGKAKGAISFIASESSTYYTESDLATAQELASRISLAITNSVLYGEVQAELKHRKQLQRQLLRERDILEERVAKRTVQLSDLNISLSNSNQELQDFAYVASHDLQEPLRKIQAFGDILQTEYMDKLGDGADYLKRMHAAATRMSQLIEDLLAFSRVTTRPPSPTKVDLNDIVDDVLNDLENQVTRTKGQIDVSDLPVVLADPTHMRQLFQNLISNGLKFHHENKPPVIAITAKPVSGASKTDYEIKVSDNGIGFDEKYNDRIFGVFQRLHGRDSYEGTGIGLAVSRKIVERYGGTITAEGCKGKGASFIIKFPAIST